MIKVSFMRTKHLFALINLQLIEADVGTVKHS